MTKKYIFIFFMTTVLIFSGCIKETYDMNRLSEKIKYSPSMAMAVAKGKIILSDIIKSNDTIIFDNDNFIRIVFKKDSVFNLEMTDFYNLKNMAEFNGTDKVQLDLELFNPVFNFTKEYFGQQYATIEPDTINFEIDDILSNITGTFSISNPSVKINYSNSFTNSIDIDLNVTGKRKDITVNLDLEPFTLLHPVAPADPDVSASFKIDTSNSSLSELISLPPEEIYISGTAIMDISGKNSQNVNYVLGSNRFVGSLEFEIPMELRVNNLQFSDTVDNFLSPDDSGNDSFEPDDMDSLQVKITAENGFPFGVSVKMMLFDKVYNAVLKTIDATDIIQPAPVDNNGKVTAPAESATTIEFSEDFFSSIGKADKIIFVFTLYTTGSGTKDVKIYSDYFISFTASLVVKPNLIL